jgi:hypothetical protein
MTMGCEGIGIYWCLVEMLYEQNGSLPLTDLEIYAKTLNTTLDKLEKTLSSFDLFTKNRTHFYSSTLLKRLKHINIKREKARASAKLSHSANADRTHSERSAIYKKKEEDIIREEKKDFSFNAFWDKYPKQVGMSLALMTYRATVKTKEDFDNLMAALNNYLKSDEVKKGFIKNGSNWIEDWRGWIPKKPIKAVVKDTPTPEPDPKEREKVAGLIHKTVEEIGKKK